MIYIKLKQDMYGYKKDTILKIKTCANGVPLERNWRKRLNDSEKDGCLTVISGKTKTKKALTPKNG